MTGVRRASTAILRSNINELTFVPQHKPVTNELIQCVQEFIDSQKKILVLTGAGISTESGIPDYRSKEVGLYARSSNRPVQYQQFVKNHHIRKRYWARNYVGWPRFSNIKPNSNHYFLSNLENKENKISSVVTQNVDCLHTKAGSKKVIELHGSAFLVKCINCDHSVPRHEFQDILQKLNPKMRETSNFIRPDGDVELSEELITDFTIPYCTKCNGILKPDIVFFGDNVPKTRVEQVNKLITESDSVLVVGSSLSVYSGYRIILLASELKKFITIINIGDTRADHLANIKIEAKCSEILNEIHL